MSRELSEKGKRLNLLIAPPGLKNYGILDPDKAEEVFALGYKATREKLAGIDVGSVLR
jgi:predicted acylesterase/phospholipase RssA